MIAQGCYDTACVIFFTSMSVEGCSKGRRAQVMHPVAQANSTAADVAGGGSLGSRGWGEAHTAHARPIASFGSALACNSPTPPLKRRLPHSREPLEGPPNKLSGARSSCGAAQQRASPAGAWALPSW